MSTTAPPLAAAAPRDVRPTQAGSAPLLVATDGAEESAVTLEAARLLAAHLGAAVHVLAVLEPLPLITRDSDIPTWLPELEDARREDLLRCVRAQMHGRGGHPEWPVEVREGAPAPEITAIARELNARLVLVGLGKHGLPERLLGDETTLQLLRLCDAPVLALGHSFPELPHRVVVATDLSAASLAAARAALPVLRPDATLYLAHVLPAYAALGGVWEALQLSYAEELPEAMETFRQELGAPPPMRTEIVTLSGGAAREVLALADRVGADLIVAGTHGRGFFSRLVLGSVTTQLVRRATCAVLVMPAPANVAHGTPAASARGG